MARRGPPDMARRPSPVRRMSFDVTRHRYDPPTVNADGYLVDAGETTTTIRAHVYDATPETLERLPDGLEGRRIVEGGTDADLRLGDEATGARPDAIAYDGALFEVVGISPWPGGATGARTWRSFVAAEVVR